jgi:hypothetical protein
LAEWLPLGDEIPGQTDCRLSIDGPGTETFTTADVVEWVVELQERCPAAFVELRLALAAEAMDQTGADIMNLRPGRQGKGPGGREW